MRRGLAIKIHAFLERKLPERRVFLKSDSDTRFIRLTPESQFATILGAGLFVSWSIVATSIVLMDSIGSGNFREQAKRDQAIYRSRLNQISEERDARAGEALAAQDRFNAALEQISVMQSELLASETRLRELETGLEIVQSNLRDRLKERDGLRVRLAAMEEQTTEGGTAQSLIGNSKQFELLAEALNDTADERDQILTDARDALDQRDALELELRLTEQRNDQIFRQLEEAMKVSVEPLNKMFRNAGLPPDRILEQVRRGYNGQGGGPLEPLPFSTRGEGPSTDEQRANALLSQMRELNTYRVAAEHAPFSEPVVRGAARLSSPFGFRRHPVTGGRRMHKGIDLAGPTGTDIYATADGVVTFSGWQSGYGRIVIIQHDFGIETRYAHNTNNRVKAGQRVSRGQHIADMGSTGRSTGPHLHYEIRVGGKPVNPMIYIKAARNVF